MLSPKKLHSTSDDHCIPPAPRGPESLMSNDERDD